MPDPEETCVACMLSKAFGISHDEAVERWMQCLGQSISKVMGGYGPLTEEEFTFTMRNGDVAGHG
jgi:hypothetical protein